MNGKRIIATLFVLTSLASIAPAQSSVTPAEARAIAKEAYIYGFPMEDSYRVMYAFSVNKDSPEYKGPFNSVLNVARVFTPDDKAFVTPNSDTPYTFLGLDLRAQPVVITLPPIEKNRYYVFQMMDLYTYNFDYLGTRTTGNNGGSYLVAGPGWKGEAPKGIAKVIRAETDLVNVIGRTQLFDPSDLDNVKRIQAGYKVQLLSEYLGEPAPAAAPATNWLKPLTPPEQRTSLEFFNVLNFVLQFAPTPPSETALRERFAQIGVKPGKPFDVKSLSDEMKSALQQGMIDGQKELDVRRAALGGKIDTLFGTRAFLKDDYVNRAVGAQVGIGANSRDEALYPIYEKDSSGQPLDGSKGRYVLRFAKDAFPPVSAFWSLTMYQLPSQLLVKNPLNRYLINSPMLPNLKRDADGGLTIYIQSESPGKDQQSNWLPAPNGPFMLTMRYYLPKPELLEGEWKSPVVERIASATATSSSAPVSEQDARAIAKDAYIYAFAMLENYNTMYKQLADPAGPEYVGGFGKFRHYSQAYTPDNHDVVTPNNDTPYSWAWLDLRAEPWVVSVPAVPDKRYYVQQWVDLFTYNFAYIGSRATGNGPGDYLIAGPNWKGTTPKGIKQVFHSETEVVMTLTRTALDGPDDVSNVKAVQSGMKLQPLSTFTKTAPPATPPSIAFPPYDSAKARTHDFIAYLNFLLQFTLPTNPSEVDLMKRFAKIGIGPGLPFDSTTLPPDELVGIDEGVKDAHAALAEKAKTTLSSNGLFGTREDLKNDYLTRAIAAEKGLYGNSLVEAWYGGYVGDGRKQSMIHFPKGQLPPAKFFWSMTLYTLPDRFLYANPLERYSIGDRTKGLVFDADGGLTIYIGNASPGKDKESNWLPAPAGMYSAVGRLYGPSAAAMDGTWKLPQLEPVVATE